MKSNIISNFFFTVALCFTLGLNAGLFDLLNTLTNKLQGLVAALQVPVGKQTPSLDRAVIKGFIQIDASRFKTLEEVMKQSKIPFSFDRKLFPNDTKVYRKHSINDKVFPFTYHMTLAYFYVPIPDDVNGTIFEQQVKDSTLEFVKKKLEDLGSITLQYDKLEVWDRFVVARFNKTNDYDSFVDTIFKDGLKKNFAEALQLYADENKPHVSLAQIIPRVTIGLAETQEQAQKRVAEVIKKRLIQPIILVPDFVIKLNKNKDNARVSTYITTEKEVLKAVK